MSLNRNDRKYSEMLYWEKFFDRGGSGLLSYNKVDNTEKKALRVTRIDSRSFYCFVHGQMSEIRLENTLLDFILKVNRYFSN